VSSTSGSAWRAESPPIFIGETPRSGSHALAHLIGSHSRYHVLPEEVVFHANTGGLVGYLDGSLSREELLDALRGRWWRRPAPWDRGETFGLSTMVDGADFEAALAEFQSVEDPVEAGRALVTKMLDPMAARAGKSGWVEHTPHNVGACVQLARLFPEAKFIHVVRDGRDRACSVVRLPWGPDSIEEAIRAWAWKLQSDEAEVRKLEPGRLLVVQLEDLVLVDRERTYERLLEFLGLEGEERMHAFFETDVTARRAHVGRWRSEIAEPERSRIALLYSDTLARLREAGVSSAPADREIDVSYGRDESEPPNPYDTWSSGTYAPLGERLPGR
jgi:hypothetical protein